MVRARSRSYDTTSWGTKREKASGSDGSRLGARGSGDRQGSPHAVTRRYEDEGFVGGGGEAAQLQARSAELARLAAIDPARAAAAVRKSERASVAMHPVSGDDMRWEALRERGLQQGF